VRFPAVSWAGILAQAPPPEDSGVSGLGLVELVAAGILALVGLRSLWSWMRSDFDAGSGTEQLLFALHVTARVGLWFAFAGFFLGHALLDEPQQLGWYLYVVIGLAAVQLLTGMALARAPAGSAAGTPGDDE
jgi:hypothetical protein